MNTMTNHIRGPQRARRCDGLSTRGAILEVAGQVFAERGYAEATSKEICERAGTNGAAVNYHFGGKESLYEQVLVEAHRQMVSLEDLDAIVGSGKSPKGKLRAFFSLVLCSAARAPELWGIKIFLRELLAPSPSVDKLLATAVLPKIHAMRTLIQDATGLPAESPHVQRALVLVVMPCIGLILFPEKLRSALLPATTADAEGLIDDMLTYTFSGLRALGTRGKRDGTR